MHGLCEWNIYGIYLGDFKTLHWILYWLRLKNTSDNAEPYSDIWTQPCWGGSRPRDLISLSVFFLMQASSLHHTAATVIKCLALYSSVIHVHKVPQHVPHITSSSKHKNLRSLSGLAVGSSPSWSVFPDSGAPCHRGIARHVTKAVNNVGSRCVKLPRVTKLSPEKLHVFSEWSAFKCLITSFFFVL